MPVTVYGALKSVLTDAFAHVLTRSNACEGVVENVRSFNRYSVGSYRPDNV